MANENTVIGNAGTTGKETVTVACKLPHGLTLRVHDMVDAREAVHGGYQTVKKAQPRPDVIEIKGYLPKYKSDLPMPAIGSSYAFTHGVDKAFFDLWMEQNKDHDAVKNNLIFASVQTGRVESKARDYEKETKSGLEPYDPSKDKGRVAPYSANSI